MTSHEPSSLTGAYALDALDESERAAFEAHLADCADCAAEVASLRAAAAELSHTTTTPPPPELRADILSAISATRLSPPHTRNVAPLAPRRHIGWLWPAVAAACAIIAVIAAGWGYQQHQDANRQRGRATAVAAVLGSPDVATVTAAVGKSGHATLVFSRSRHRFVLIGHDIAAPPRNKTYQLWTITANGTTHSAGLFTPSSDGRALVQASANLAAATKFGISVEPPGGSAQPTRGAIVALLRI